MKKIKYGCVRCGRSLVDRGEFYECQNKECDYYAKKVGKWDNGKPLLCTK